MKNTNNACKDVRFWYARPDSGAEFLMDITVTLHKPTDNEIAETSAPNLYSIEVNRVESEEGKYIYWEEFIDCWDDLKYFAAEAAKMEDAPPRFFTHEISAASLHLREMERLVERAEFNFEQAEANLIKAKRLQKDAFLNLKRIRSNIANKYDY